MIRWGRPLVRPGCLTRGITGYYILRRAGLDVALCFGVGLVPGTEVAGHCWLVLDGEPVLETAEPRPVFTELVRLSSAGSRARTPRHERSPRQCGPAACLADTYSLCGVAIEVRATEEVAALIGPRLRFLRSPVPKPVSLAFDIRDIRDIRREEMTNSPCPRTGQGGPFTIRPAASSCTSMDRTSCSSTTPVTSVCCAALPPDWCRPRCSVTARRASSPRTPFSRSP